MYRENLLIGLAHNSEYPVTFKNFTSSKIHCQSQMLGGTLLVYYKIIVFLFVCFLAWLIRERKVFWSMEHVIILVIIHCYKDWLNILNLDYSYSPYASLLKAQPHNFPNSIWSHYLTSHLWHRSHSSPFMIV